MEEMLGQKMRPPLVLAQFLADYKSALHMPDDDDAEVYAPKTDADIQAVMQLCGDDTKDERFHAAAEATALEHLRQLDDARVTTFMPGLSEMHRRILTQYPNDALRLNTFSMLLQAKETGTKSPFKRSQDIFKMVQLPAKCREEAEQKSPKDKEAELQESELPVESEKADEADLLEELATEPEKATPCDFFNDLLLTVRVYRPARATHVGQSLEKPVFAEEFQCLGSNLLTELRDKISCVCNGRRFYDVSENPGAELLQKDLEPGYFFITDTFYNDQRNPNNPDYSATIRTWARRATGLKDLRFKVAAMEGTRFLDLSVSIGFPQLYQHHGNCEHVFTFSQVEVITPGARCLERRHYPRLCSFGLYNDRTCNMCGRRHYDFIVEGSERQLHDPAYLCSKCFYGFHYVNGQKLGEFRAYRIKNTALPDIEGGVSAAEQESSALLAPTTQEVDDAMAEVDNAQSNEHDEANYLVEDVEEPTNELVAVKMETNEI